MNGSVDDELRAILEVPVGAVAGEAKLAVKVWVDTAFNGGVILARDPLGSAVGTRRVTTKGTQSTQKLALQPRHCMPHFGCPAASLLCRWAGIW